MKKNVTNNEKNKLIEKISKMFFYFGIFLLSFIFFNIFISSFLFIFKIAINEYTFLISFLLSILFNIWLIKRNNDYKLSFLIITIIVPILIILSSVFISGKLYDYSYDGNTYHKLTVGKMADGWNPVYQNVSDFDEQNDVVINTGENSIWVDHYAKASHIFAANTMKVTNNIESGKCIGIISAIALFFLIISFVLYEMKDYLLSVLLGITIVGCTTIISQLFIYYIDSLTYIYFFLLMMSFFMFEKFTLFKDKTNYLIIFFIALTLGINIKFSLFAYDGLFCLGYYIWYLFRLKKKQIDVKFFKKFTIVSIISVIVAIFVIGLSVYPKNMISKGNPFYPLMGDDKVDIMTSNQPTAFKEKTPIEKFIIATFSKADNIYEAADKETKFKIPFTVDSTEMSFTDSSDLRISGNGVLFSGILIVSSLLFAIYIRKIYKKDKELFYLIIIPTIITILMIIFLDEAWWARYFPQLHLIVFFTLLMLLKIDNKNSNKLLYMLIAIIFINNYFVLTACLNRTSTYSSEMNNMRFQLINDVENDNCNIQVYHGPFGGAVYNVLYNTRDKKIEMISGNEYNANSNQFNEFMYVKWRCK